MKTYRTLALLVAVVLLLSLSCHACATLYVGYDDLSGNGGNGVGTYNQSTGATLNSSFISGLHGGDSLALSGNTLYVGDGDNSLVGTYNATTGAAINPGFISGTRPFSLALSGNVLYVGDTGGSGAIGTYNATTGAVINADFISSSDFFVFGAALSGNTLYVATSNGISFTDNRIRTYDAITGAVINPTFITGLINPVSSYPFISGGSLYFDVNNGNGTATVMKYNASTGTGGSFISTSFIPKGLATDDSNDLFVGDFNNSTVREYNATTGALINATFATTPANPAALLVSTPIIPEPSTDLLIGGGLALMALWRRNRTA